MRWHMVRTRYEDGKRTCGRYKASYGPVRGAVPILYCIVMVC